MTNNLDTIRSSVKALVFDTFGTVVDWRGSIIAEGESVWRARGVDVDWPKFADAWRAGYGPAMNRVRTGELPWTKLDDLHRMRLDELLVEFGVSGLSEADKDELNRIWHRLRPWPDAVAGLTRLKSRYIISPMSNGNLALLTNMAKFGGIPWDCILASDICRHYKPDPETYLMAVEMLGLQRHEVMMTAAHANDLLSAQKLGLRTGYVYRPDERGPERTVERADFSLFDVAADDYAGLASAMGV
jgi:2-haloacid dehalogenase